MEELKTKKWKTLELEDSKKSYNILFSELYMFKSSQRKILRESIISQDTHLTLFQYFPCYILPHVKPIL